VISEMYRGSKHGHDFECENIPLLMGISCSLIKQGPGISLNLQEVHQQQPHQDYLFFNWHPRVAPESDKREQHTSREHKQKEQLNQIYGSLTWHFSNLLL
jgi:hypothetical protein